MFVAHLMLYKFLGENRTTPPSCLRRWTDADEPLLLEQGTFCAHWDDDRLVSGPLYERGTVVLPEWLSPEQWLRDVISWKYAWGAGVDPRWPEVWQVSLRHLRGTAERLAAVGLLKTRTFRSPMRESFRNQIVSWLETPPGDRKYPLSPLSPKQWDVLVNRHVALDASRIDSDLYRSRSEHGVPRCSGYSCATPEACKADPDRAVDCLWGKRVDATPPKGIGPSAILAKMEASPLPERPRF